MHSIKDTINDLIHNDNLKNSIFKPIGSIIYNEVYFYVLLILVYCSLLFLAILGSLFFLLNIYKKVNILENRLISLDTL
jgi:hypothetical protein